MAKSNKTRHGKRAEGTTSLTFVLSKTTKAELKAMAKAQGRTLSNLLKVKCSEFVRRSRSAKTVGASK